MTRSRRGVWVRAMLALAIGIVWPHLEIGWKCRSGFADSEACVWGKAFFSLSRWLEPLIIAPMLFLALSLAASLWRSRRDNSDTLV